MKIEKNEHQNKQEISTLFRITRIIFFLQSIEVTDWVTQKGSNASKLMQSLTLKSTYILQLLSTDMHFTQHKHIASHITNILNQLTLSNQAASESSTYILLSLLHVLLSQQRITYQKSLDGSILSSDLNVFDTISHSIRIRGQRLIKPIQCLDLCHDQYKQPTQILLQSSSNP